MVDTDEIEKLIEPSIASSGYRLVRVLLTEGRGTTLQVMAERRDDMPMSVDDCARISQNLSAILDVADPIAHAYRLEVSSPGIDRPLVKPADFDRFEGHEARIELGTALGGRKRFRGRLGGIVGGALVLATTAGEARLPLADVARANLVGPPAGLRGRPALPSQPASRRRRAGLLKP